MNECRARLNAIQRLVDERDVWLPIIVQETCYLQLRALCESVAICCIIAHGEINDRGILRAYEASTIIKKLDRLSQNFFPRAVVVDHIEGGVHLTDVPQGCATKTDVIKLWEKSGRYVHRGSAKRLIDAGTSAINVDLDEILSWGLKIKKLLTVHLISSWDNRRHFLVYLSHEQVNGGSLVCLAQSPSGEIAC